MDRTHLLPFALLLAAVAYGCDSNDETDAGLADSGGEDAGPVTPDAGVDAGPRLDGGPTGCLTDCEYVEISVGALHVCGRRENGEVLCWGRNQELQLGDGRGRHDDCAAVGLEPEDCSGAPVNVRFQSGGARPILADATALAVDGFSSSCAIREGGQLWCWSTETVPAAGGEEGDQRPVALREPPFDDVRAASASGGHLCAIEGDSGGIRCYGSPSRARLGNGALGGSTFVVDPVTVQVLNDPIPAILDGGMPDAGPMLDAGMFDAGMFDAGTFDAGMADAGVMVDAGFAGSTPRTGALEISQGSAFTCARTAGDVFCWGDNENEQLGDGTTTVHSSCPVSGADDVDCSGYAVQVGGAGAARLGEVTDIDVGSNTACAVKMGAVFCWGDNRAGQAGQPVEFESAGLPERVGTIDDAIQVAVGSRHSCALHATGAISCWGTNLELQLGDGVADHGTTCTSGGTTADCSREPVSVATIDDATYLAANSATTCAIRANGSVWCWGFNTNRQLGDGTRMNRSAPVQVMGTP